MEAIQLLFCCLILLAGISTIYSRTDPQDAAVLRSLRDQWKNTPPSWDKSDDSCGDWDGITCNNATLRVTSIGLSTVGLTGTITDDIRGLKELFSLDLSFNPGLTGPLSPGLGDLQNLNILILAGCSFSGHIPSELGNLANLSFLALNTNNLTGPIPASLASLTELYWLDLAENQLTGPLSVAPGLDQLKKAKHLLFNSNQFEGTFPPTIVEVQTLEVLRLDRNALSGNIPSNLNRLVKITELNLAHNLLTGNLPNLTGMNMLSYVDLSNNSFERIEAAEWFSTLQFLTTLVIEHGPLLGSLPPKVFSLPQIQQVKLKSNTLSGKLDMGGNVSQKLQLIDLEDNDISSVTLSSEYASTLILIGNPVCETAPKNAIYCEARRLKNTYSTSQANCGSRRCALEKI